MIGCCCDNVRVGERGVAFILAGNLGRRYSAVVVISYHTARLLSVTSMYMGVVSTQSTHAAYDTANYVFSYTRFTAQQLVLFVYVCITSVEQCMGSASACM